MDTVRPASAATPGDRVTERKIEYLSPPAKVSMAHDWYDIASLEHFWIRRRFEVFQRYVGKLVADGSNIAEIGCGHGLLQRQVEDAHNREVIGLDLNEYALRRNISRMSQIFCYDIFQKEATFREKFGLILLFDVLEHIEDEQRFMEAVLYHLAFHGRVIINVPCGRWLYSTYDRVVGHVRRYSVRSLSNAARRSGLSLESYTYWGLPLLPSLVVRKVVLLGADKRGGVIKKGFDTRGTTVNKLLGLISRWEPIPQHLLGTSIMAVLSRGSDAGSGRADKP